jgi:hypothetical protein
MSTSAAPSMLFTNAAQSGTKASMDQPRVDVSSQKRLTAQEHTALANAADMNTIARITQIWADRLQLTSVYVSCQSCSATQTQRIHPGKLFHVHR